jgi:hypothetical protein
MNSFPLKVWKTFRNEQGQVANSEEYQPLTNDPTAPEPPEPEQTMGTGERTPKPETRMGDLPAEWAAYVRPNLVLFTLNCANLSCRCPLWYIIVSFGRSTPDRSLHQIFLSTTWLMALNGSPSTPFTYHPVFQSLGVSCFAYGEICSQHLCPTRDPI